MYLAALQDDPVLGTAPRLGADDFNPWNREFTDSALADAGCIDSPLDLIDNDAHDIIQPLGAKADTNCVTQALNITVIRAPVSDAQVEIIPLESGIVTLRLYSNPSGGTPIFESAPQAVVGGERVLLGAFDAQPRLIRRIEITLDNQPVRLTQLTLLPVLATP